MNPKGIRALVAKDFTLFFRNRFFALVTLLGLAVYVALYFVMPSSVNETMDIGLYGPALLPIADQTQQQGLEIHVVESEDDLKDGVTAHDYVAGIAIPGDLIERLASGQRPHIDLYFASDTPEEAQADYLNKDNWRKRAELLKSYKGGFRAFKIDIHPSLGARNGEFFPTITPRTAAKVQKVYSLAREALGPDYDIIVHGHNELDVSSAIKFAQAVEEIPGELLI